MGQPFQGPPALVPQIGNAPPQESVVGLGDRRHTNQAPGVQPVAQSNTFPYRRGQLPGDGSGLELGETS